MKKTLVKIGSIVIITALISAVAVAQEKPAAASDSGAYVKKLEAMGAARARFQQTYQEVSKLTDASVNGFSTRSGAIQINYEKTCQLLDKAIQQEQAKPAAEQNAEQLKAMLNERQNVAQLWSKYANIDLLAINVKIAAAYQRWVSGLTPVYSSLSAMDGGWTKLNLDMDALKSMYELAEKGAAELKAEQQAALADMDAQVKVWQDALTNATSRNNVWIGITK